MIHGHGHGRKRNKLTHGFFFFFYSFFPTVDNNNFLMDRFCITIRKKKNSAGEERVIFAIL